MDFDQKSTPEAKTLCQVAHSNRHENREQAEQQFRSDSRHRKGEKHKNGGRPRSLPGLKRSISLHTWVAQKVYERGFITYQKDVFTLTSKLRDAGLDEPADRAESFVNAELIKVNEALHNDLARCESLLQEMEVKELPEYTDAQQFTPRISSSYSNRFLDTILLLDQIMQRQDVLSILGHIEQKDRDSRMRMWKQTLLRMTGRTRNYASHVRGVLRQYEDPNRPKGFDVIAEIKAIHPAQGRPPKESIQQDAEIGQPENRGDRKLVNKIGNWIRLTR